MINKEKIKERATAIGGKDWAVLADAFDDAEFLNVLTNQEKNFLTRIESEPNIIASYRDHFSNIVAKYVSWIVFKKSNLGLIRDEVTELSNKVRLSGDELKVIRDSAKYIGGATVLVEYSKAFSERAKTHQGDARLQLLYYLFSLVGFAIIVGLTFSFSIADFPSLRNLMPEDLRGLPFNTGFLAMKIFLLVFAYQVTQFFRKNYGAEKHLQEVYQHRSDVLQSLNAVYNALSNNEEKDKILSAGALFAYERGKTGYITTKEGAGSETGLLEGALGRIFR